MSIKWERDLVLGKQLLSVIEDHELTTGHEVHAVNIVREPVTSVGTPHRRTRIVDLVTIVKRLET